MTLPRHPAHVAIRSGTTINEGLREAHPVDDGLQPTATTERASDAIRPIVQRHQDDDGEAGRGGRDIETERARREQLGLSDQDESLSARSTHSTRTSASTGLFKKQRAPPASARSFRPASVRAVIMIIGVSTSCSARRRCRSRPLIPGIWMSEMMQETVRAVRASRNSSAEPKAQVSWPSEEISATREDRIESSSSTMEI